LSAIAKITLGIRHLNKSLAVNPSDDESFVLLGRAYLQLGSVEQLIAGPNLPARLQKLRQIQALSVFRQATELNAENMMAWDGLFQIHQQLNHGDMTLEALTKWLELAEKQTQTDTQFEEFLTSRFLLRDDLEKQIEETEGKVAESVKTQLEQLKAADTNAGKVDNPAGIQQAAERDLLATVSIWQTSGFHKKALETIEADLPVAQASPFGRFLYGNLLLDGGQLEEGNRMLIGISQEAIQSPNAIPGVEWQLPTAISQMAVCDYDSAIDTWSSEIKVVATNAKAADHLWTVAHTMPLVADAHLLVNSPLPVWPFHNINAVGTAAQTANELPAELMFLVAMAQVEKGSNSEARKTLAKVISEFGNCRVRPLASAYYALLEEKAVELFMQYASDNAEEFIYPGEKFPEPAATPGVPGTAPGQPANMVAPGTGPIAPPAAGAKQPQ
jgi:tetratricopeptide (TPR) repeat protein